MPLQSDDVDDQLGSTILANLCARGINKRKLKEIEEQTSIQATVITETRKYKLWLPPFQLAVFDPNSSPIIWCPNIKPVHVEAQVEMQQDEHMVLRPVENPVFGVFLYQVGGETPSRFAPILTEVTDVAVDDKHMYVVDSLLHRVCVFDKESLAKLYEWGSHGAAAGQFNFSENQKHFVGEGHKYVGGCITVDDENVYVSDKNNGRIQVFNKVGKFDCTWGACGNEDGRFCGPAGIAVSDDVIFVSDSGNHRVQFFCKKTKEFLGSWGTRGSANGQFNYPAGLAVDSGHVYVCDSENNRVQIFDLKGVYVQQIDLKQRHPTSLPSGISVTSTSIFVSLSSKIDVFCKADLSLLRSFGGRSWGDRHWDKGQFHFPRGITVQSGLLYVADSGNHRVQVFR